LTALFYTYFDKPLRSDLFRRLTNQLPPDTISKIKKFKKWQDAHACLFGRLLLKEMLSLFSIDQDLGKLRYTNYQKPYFENSDFNFNISHSGKYVVCAGTNQSKLGVDIEEIKSINIQEFKEQFHIEEWGQIKNANNLATFYKFWTMKEAIIKADGKGLSIPLNSLNLSGISNRVKIDQIVWSLHEIHLDEYYVCYMAYLGGPVNGIIRRLVNFELL
jgi:4'-phosphopantetheinyl transferase